MVITLMDVRSGWARRIRRCCRPATTQTRFTHRCSIRAKHCSGPPITSSQVRDVHVSITTGMMSVRCIVDVHCERVHGWAAEAGPCARNRVARTASTQLRCCNRTHCNCTSIGHAAGAVSVLDRQGDAVVRTGNGSRRQTIPQNSQLIHGASIIT